MKAIWKKKIDELNEIIAEVNVYDVDRLRELFYKRELLELAYYRVF